MKKKIVLCIVLAGLIFSLAGCAEEAGQPEAGVQQENSAVSEEEFAGDGAWTILVYLCGTDLESGYGAATMDLGEMLDRDFGRRSFCRADRWLHPVAERGHSGRCDRAV